MIEIVSPLAASATHDGWLTQNAAWLVGVVGIVVSGIAGPSVNSWWGGKREREKDARAQTIARRDDLRAVADEAAKALSGAISQIRPALVAEREGGPFPTGSRDFLGELFAPGQRLRLRAGAAEPPVSTYESAREQLIELAKATGSQREFDAAVHVFEERRAAFLEAVRVALQAPIEEKART